MHEKLWNRRDYWHRSITHQLRVLCPFPSDAHLIVALWWVLKANFVINQCRVWFEQLHPCTWSPPLGLLELIILTLAPCQPSPNMAGKPTMLWEAAKTNEKLQKCWANRWPMQIWKWHTYSDASATEGQWIRPKATWKLQTCNKVKSQATTSRRGGPCASRRLCVSKACRRAFNSPSANIAGDLAQRIFRPMRMQGSFPCIIMRSKGQQVWPGPSHHSVAGPCDSPFP